MLKSTLIRAIVVGAILTWNATCLRADVIADSENSNTINEFLRFEFPVTLEPSSPMKQPVIQQMIESNEPVSNTDFQMSVVPKECNRTVAEPNSFSGFIIVTIFWLVLSRRKRNTNCLAS